MQHNQRTSCRVVIFGFWAICCLVSMLSPCVSVAVTFPAPIDVPHGPDGVSGPGGVALPTLSVNAPADTLAISAINEVCFPDETLVITGDKLKEASLRVWLEGRVEELTPIRTADNRMQALLPKTWPLSTMLVWPTRGEQTGSPIRVNGATVWWAWPARLSLHEVANPTDVLLMGKNLKLGSAEPRVYLKGPGVGQWIAAIASQAYQLKVQLPGGLQPGTYQLFAHNGTGGAFGWSEASQLEVIQAPSQDKPAVFEVDQFGAKPNDGLDDAPAIQKAVDAAVKSGGGTVRFAAGIFHLAHAITLPDVPGSGIHLGGAGMGDYDGKTQTTTGHGTVLRFLADSPAPKCLLQIGCRFSSVRDLTLVGGHEGIVRGIHDRNGPTQVVARVTQHDVTFDRVRLALLDLRPNVPQEKRQDLQLYDPALHLIAPGKANLVVRNCEFHSAGAGIDIGSLQRDHMEDSPPDPSTDYVHIAHCIFRGYSPGFYKEPLDEGSYGCMGCLNQGVNLFNGKYVVVQCCDFAGADRRGGKMMNRSFLAYNSSVRDVYVADNLSRDVGMVCPHTDRYVNQGEQILFHFRYPHGGYFDVLEAGPDHVTVNPADPRNNGVLAAPHATSDRAKSRVLSEVGTNDHWVLFISAGKGAGQYRVVVGANRKPDRTILTLDRPWRVVPDRSSRVTLTAAYRQNIIFHNSIDAGFIDPRSKVTGILFWFNAFDNVIAGNTLKNVGYGVGLNSSFRNPCCWNLTRDNTMEQLGGMSVECAAPAFYFDSCGAAGGPKGPLFRTDSDMAGWYAVGNVARSNNGNGSSTAMYVYAEMDDATAQQLSEHNEAGVAMPVIENNRMTGVKQGIITNRGAVWPVIRNNSVKTDVSTKK